MLKGRTVCRLVRIGVLALVMGGAAALLSCYLVYERAPQAQFLAAGPNALWLAHEWVGAAQADERYDELAARLGKNRITDAFFHVGPLESDGRIAPGRYKAARRLLQELHRKAPALRAQAWIGQVEKSGAGPLDLSQASVRLAIAETARGLLDTGFAGIHLNIEPSTGNPHLLDLLGAILAIAKAHGAVLSIATDELEPLPGLAWLTRIAGTRAGFWTAAYYRAVFERVDQVAVMMYDTGLPTDWLYGTFVNWQTRAIRDLASGKVTVLMGVPTYEEHRLSFHPDAENIRSALRGIRQGLAADAPGPPTDFGVAIYADWTTDASEWRHYRTNWLGIAP